MVESVGDGVFALRPGDHVVCALAVPCGTCRQCVRGLAAHCNSPRRAQAIAGLAADGTSRLRRDGAPVYPFFGVGTLSEYTTVRQEQAVRIDPALPLDEFCLAGCGVVTGVGAVLEHRPGPAGRHRGGHRLRRRGCQRHPGVADRRGGQDHRD